MRAIATPEKCAKAFADGIEKRSRRVYVPRSIVLLHWLRNVNASLAAEQLLKPLLRTAIPKLEQEVRQLGRYMSERNQKINS